MITKQTVLTSDAEQPAGPYSQALKIGNQVYISGQIGVDPATGNLVPGGGVAEAEQVMKNLTAVLAACGCTFANVVKATIYLRDFEILYPPVNQIYERYLVQPYPVRTTIGVTHLADGASVEIDLIANLEDVA
ncbi:MAG: Rid family detoxifying hydrolase [Oculatellaceae cyanobacterium Prado106]|jgi:2-iminobutanoate/2-iminopropanoate deaminase|nr:Rid family detoxifying hydrolase [Oculatellaceae cyanobacterium Prado106]